MDIRETKCRGCCATPFGVCATNYRCRHHREAAESALAKASAASLHQELRLRHRPSGGPLSAQEKRDVVHLRGVETAPMIAARYGVSVSTVRNLWAKHNRDLKNLPREGQATGEAAELIARIRTRTGWTMEEIARRAGVTSRTLARVRTGEYATVSKKVMDALEAVAHRESIHA